jgi:hypothetical protein
MHLVTGFLLTALLGRGSSSGPRKPPNYPDMIETAHLLPGRVRFRVPSLVGEDEVAALLQSRLGSLESVTTAAVSPVTGSVLIAFEAELVEATMLQAAVMRLLGMEELIGETPESRVGRETRNLGDALNHAVYEQSGGMIDLWTGLPLLLAAVGLRNVLSKNGALGWPLLWWAYVALLPPR